MPGEFDYSVTRSSELPLGTQLAWKIRTQIEQGELQPGERLPSVRDLARRAQVNVNTVRAVYGRLEEQGVVVSEQGRGTFVADVAVAGSPAGTKPAEAPDKAALRREIERLEAEVARRPQPPSAPDPEVFAQAPRKPAPGAGGLLSAEELQRVRDSLLERLDEIEDARSEVRRALERLDEAERAEVTEGIAPDPVAESEPRPDSRSASTLGPVRVRWVGGA